MRNSFAEQMNKKRYVFYEKFWYFHRFNGHISTYGSDSGDCKLKSDNVNETCMPSGMKMGKLKKLCQKEI